MRIKLLLSSFFVLFISLVSGGIISKKTITVTNEKEFIEALRDNTKILIKTRELNLSYYSINAFLPQGSDKIKLNYEKTLTLNNFSNLEITAETKVNFIVDWSEQAVLSITNSRGIVLNNLRMYHKVPTTETCEGGVLHVVNVKRIQIQNCELNGSGVYGVYFINVSEASIKQSQIYNNSHHALAAISSTVLIQDSWIFKNPSFILFWIDEDSEIYFDTCYIEDNAIKKSIINPFFVFEVRENLTKVIFENCTFKNNLRGSQEVIPPHIFHKNTLVLKSSNFKPIYPVYKLQLYEFVDDKNIIYRTDEITNLYETDIEKYNQTYNK